MNRTADIVIIGGGVTGVAAGYFLMEHGAKKVVLLERDYLSAGATGRCGAGIRQQWGTKLNCLMAKYSCEFFESGTLGDLEFHQGGYLILATTAAEFRQLRKNVALQNTVGIESRFLTPDEAAEIVDLLDTTQIVGATFHQKDGHLNPFKTTQAFADGFVAKGGRIFTRTNVKSLEQKGSKWFVGTNAGTIETEAVVCAAGGYTQQLAALAGIDLPLESERHNILVTEPIERILEPMCMSFSMNFYCQQTPHGSFIMGRTCKNQPRDTNINPDSAFPTHMARTITKIMPRLSNLSMLRQWAGLYNLTPDKHPIYDEAAPGFFVACGFSGRGFMIAPASGMAIMQLVLRKPIQGPWEGLGLARFDGDGLDLEPAVV